MASWCGSCLSTWKDVVAAHKVIEVVCSIGVDAGQFGERHRSQGKAVLAGGIEDARPIVVSVCVRANRLELWKLKMGQFWTSLKGILESGVVVYARQLWELN